MFLFRFFSGPYSPVFGLNSVSYSVSLLIQSECRKIRTRKTPNKDTFHAVKGMSLFVTLSIFFLRFTCTLEDDLSLAFALKFGKPQPQSKITVPANIACIIDINFFKSELLLLVFWLYLNQSTISSGKLLKWKNSDTKEIASSREIPCSLL